MEKTHNYKSWLDTWESAVYCGNDYDEAHKLLNSVVTTIMEIKLCSMQDLIDFDCDICRNRVRPYSYSAVHGWTEAQIQQMYVGTDTLGYFVWLGPPVSLTDEAEEKNECLYFLSDTAECIYTTANWADVEKLLYKIDDYMRKYGVCSINDLAAFNVNLDNARNGFSLRDCDNWGWTENPLLNIEVSEDLHGKIRIIQLGKPVKLPMYEEDGDEPEMKFVERAIDIDRCSGCQHLSVPTFNEPCKSCIGGCNFTPRNDGKGERSLKLNVVDPRSITPKRIWFNEHDGKCFTTVEWEDGVKTTVSETLNATDYGGFTAALAKRIYGTGGTIRVMNRAIDKANEKKKLREELRKRDWLMKQWKREQDAKLRKEAHEARVREEVERLRAERDAKRRILGDQLGTFAKALSFFDCGLDKKEDHAE